MSKRNSEREDLILRYLSGLSPKEIARSCQELSCSIHRADKTPNKLGNYKNVSDGT